MTGARGYTSRDGLAGVGILSESGFTGLSDFQDSPRAFSPGKRLSVFGLSGFSVVAKGASWAKRNSENPANPVNPDSDKDESSDFLDFLQNRRFRLTWAAVSINWLGTISPRRAPGLSSETGRAPNDSAGRGVGNTPALGAKRNGEGERKCHHDSASQSYSRWRRRRCWRSRLRRARARKRRRRSLPPRRLSPPRLPRPRSRRPRRRPRSPPRLWLPRQPPRPRPLSPRPA